MIKLIEYNTLGSSIFLWNSTSAWKKNNLKIKNLTDTVKKTSFCLKFENLHTLNYTPKQI